MPNVVMDDTPIKVTWKIWEGDTASRRHRIQTLQGGQYAPWDLAGYTIAGQVKSDWESAVELAPITATPDADQITNKGVYTIVIAAGDTAGLPPRCVGDLVFTDDEDNAQTLVVFDFIVSQDTPTA